MSSCDLFLILSDVEHVSALAKALGGQKQKSVRSERMVEESNEQHDFFMFSRWMDGRRADR